jgi:1,5-anhydro-D-fructose reductase (1,5-anhydro-D-mannitol-forming)
MKTIRWGMIGCGEVAEMKSGPGFYNAAHSELVAVADRNGARAEDFARRHGVQRWHDDADAIIRAPDLDAIYIATMTDSHYEYTLRCAAAGKPVLVEKPMATSHARCREMIDACTKAGVPLWVAYYRRALPRFIALRDLVQGGAIGPIRMVVTRHFQRIPPPDKIKGPFWGWRLDPRRSGGGPFFEAIGHALDILDFVLGPIEEVRAFAGNQAGAYPAEDIVAATYRFASGAYASGAWCFTADLDDEYNEIIGANGRIRYSTFPPLDPAHGSRPAPIRITRGDDVEEMPIGDPPYVHQPLIQTIVDEMNGHGRCPSTAESAARTARVIDATLAGFSSGRDPPSRH